MVKEQEIYFHVGLSKTGSTFLQHNVFPFLENIHYVPTNKYHKIYSILPELKHKKILISREFDQQFFIELNKFVKHYPQTKIIMVLREHSEWVVSQLKRFVKNGHPYSLQEFIDIEKDCGRFTIEDLNYNKKINYLEEKFIQKALLLNYADLRKNAKGFINALCTFMDAVPNWQKINLNAKHTSYSVQSLLAVKHVSRYVNFEKKLEIHRKPIGFLYNLSANIFRYVILYTSKLLPKNTFKEQDLIDIEYLARIKEFTKSDWERAQQKFDVI